MKSNKKIILMLLLIILLQSCSHKKLTSLTDYYEDLPNDKRLNLIELEIEEIFEEDIENFIVLEIMEYPLPLRHSPARTFVYAIYFQNSTYENINGEIINREIMKIYRYSRNKWREIEDVTFQNAHIFRNNFIKKIANDEQFICNKRLNDGTYEYSIWIKYEDLEYIYCNFCFGLIPEDSKLNGKHYSIFNYLFANLLMSELYYDF